MKKGTLIGLLLCTASILGLGALAVFLNFSYKEELSGAHTEEVVTQAESAVQSLYIQQTETETETEAETQNPASVPHYIWVGDSRTVQMGYAMENADYYIAESGEGYDWFVEDGLPLLKDAIAASPDLPVIINLGVNDYCNLNNYLALYRSLMTEYPDTVFYYLAVYPIDPEVCIYITNEEIQDFNAHLKELSPDTYLDSYTFITENELLTYDGIHYPEDVLRKLYQFTEMEIASRA